MKLEDGENLSVEGSVIGLQKNLIYVGALAKQGYGFSGRGGEIKVFKNSSIVIKGKL